MGHPKTTRVFDCKQISCWLHALWPPGPLSHDFLKRRLLWELLGYHVYYCRYIRWPINNRVLTSFALLGISKKQRISLFRVHSDFGAGCPSLKSRNVSQARNHLSSPIFWLLRSLTWEVVEQRDQHKVWREPSTHWSCRDQVGGFPPVCILWLFWIW